MPLTNDTSHVNNNFNNRTIEQSNNQTIINMFNFIPVGAIMAFAGQVTKAGNNPQPFETAMEATGWMVCDGRKLKIAEYSVLYSTIGMLYTASEDGKHFNIPDYRGYFLRMVNMEQTNGEADASAENRKSINPKNSAIEIATEQNDALHSHVHLYSKVTTEGIPSTVLGGNKEPINLASKKTGTPVQPNKTSMGEKLSKKETRAKNMAVYYIIKYR